MKTFLEQAIEAISAGDKATARTLLLRFLKLHPESEPGWFWLAQAVDDPVQKRDYLQRALGLNPYSQEVQQALVRLEDEAELEPPTLAEITGESEFQAPMPSVELIVPPPSHPKRLPSHQELSAPPQRNLGRVLLGLLLAGVVCLALTFGGYRLQAGLEPCAALDVALERPSGCLYIIEQGDFVDSLAFSPDGKLLASGGAKNTVFLRQVSDGAVIRSMRMPGPRVGQVTGLSFSLEGRVVAAGGGDNSLRLWQVADGSLYRSLERVHAWYVEVDFSPDWTTFVTANGSYVGLARLQDGAIIRAFRGHTADVYTVAFSPQGDIVASGGADQTIRLWSVTQGSLLRTLRGHTGNVETVAFSPDGTLLASGGADNRVRLWQVSDGRSVRILRGHTGAKGNMFNLLFTRVSGGVRDVAFSPDGTVLASAGSDGTVRLWRVADGQFLKILSGHSNIVTKVAFSPDNRTLASGSGDSTIRVWRWQ